MRWRGPNFCTDAAAMLLGAVICIIYDINLIGSHQHVRIRASNSTASHSVASPRAARSGDNDDAHRNDTDAKGSMRTVPVDRDDSNASSAPTDPHWPLIKHMMCSDKTPNPNAWQVLFELARTELGFPPDRIAARPRDLIAFESFYKYNAGGLGYTSTPYGRYFYYPRILKAGNDQIRYGLRDALQGAGGYVEDWDATSDLFSSSAFLRTEPDNVCVVTAVRDPIQHFLSAYNEIEYRQERRRRGNGTNNETLPSYTRHENGTVARFEQFVTDFVGGPRTAGIFDRYNRWGTLEIAHAFSMTGALWGLKRLRDCRAEGAAPVPTSRLPSLDAYLPSLDDLDVEFPKLLHETCPGQPPFDSLKGRLAHESQSDPFRFRSAADRVWKDRGNVSRALCAIHALDYACFDAVPVPTLCQEIYSRPHFQHKVLHAMTTRKQTIPDLCGKGNFP